MPENPTTIIIIKYTIIFQFNRDSQLLVDLPSLEPGALSPITFFSFQSLWHNSSIGTHDSMADIPSLEQSIKVQQGLTTQGPIYPRLNGSIGTHDSKVDVPSLEQNISVQQGLTARRPMYPRLNRAPFTITFFYPFRPY